MSCHSIKDLEIYKESRNKPYDVEKVLFLMRRGINFGSSVRCFNKGIELLTEFYSLGLLHFETKAKYFLRYNVLKT